VLNEATGLRVTPDELIGVFKGGHRISKEYRFDLWSQTGAGLQGPIQIEPVFKPRTGRRDGLLAKYLKI
jgi:hypothetical protein